MISHIQELFRYIQVYSEPCVILAYLEPWYLQNPDIFKIRSILRTLAYSQPWYIQNTGIFRTLRYSKSKPCSERCQTSMMKCFAKVVRGYNYFHNYNYFHSKLAALSHEINIMIFFNTDIIFTLHVVIYVKTMAREGRGTD